MTVPLVEVRRGDRVESLHTGSIAVCDADGRLVVEIGDIDAPIFPRSAVKAIQALPLVESGAADAFGLTDAHLSLVCASHSGEPDHVETTRDLLHKAGVGETCLECGGHWSFDHKTLLDQARSHEATPGPIFNNCSGKHSGMIVTAVRQGEDPAGYIRPEHPAQERVRRAMEEVTGAVHAEANRATDGCSIPTYAVPVRKLAHGFARLATGTLPEGRREAARRLLTACMNEPFHMAGTRRFCTRIMKALPGRLFAKTGAEGVFCGALPDLGLGIALKIDDGGTRASEAAMANVAMRFLDDEALLPFCERPLKNWNGWEVGSIVPTPALRELTRA